MDLCEVVKGPRTSDSTIEAVMEFVRRIGRTPVLIRKEAHGFIVNRVVFAALEEALRLLEGGYAEVADIDLAIKKGLNWPMGPFELLDFSGIDIVYGAFVDRELLGEGPPPSPLLKRMIDEGKLGRKSGSGFYEYS
jgi:3-hydroxybutyryl-CoA dehydrogenase